MLTVEQEERVWQVALAALLHDVGKFAQRAEADPERYRTLANLHEFARTDEHGVSSYHHAAYTWQFIEQHIAWLCGVGEGAAENVAGWAARHHRPSTACDWIVAEADCLSAGMDRGHRDEAPRGWSHVQGARLTPLLGRVRGFEVGTDWERSLRALALDEALFPQSSTDHDRAAAVREYEDLFEQFTRSVERIPGGYLPRFFQSFLTTYERYAWCVPAATNASPCDVSLFEHSRAAAAVAAALAVELLRTDRLTDAAARDRSAERYLLVVGDLSGIQRFLYTIVTENAARALRGRSFFLQLLADAIATRVLREFCLPPANALYNGGGKLWLLLPAWCSHRLRSLTEEIDVRLQAQFGGRLGFTVGIATLTGTDFVRQAVAERWEAATTDLHQRRRRRFSESLTRNYRDIFEPFGEPGDDTLCHVCGKLDRDLQNLPGEGRRACAECRDLERLGSLLTRARSVVRAPGSGWRLRLERARERVGGASHDCWYSDKVPELLDVGYLVAAQDPQELLRSVSSTETVLSVNDAGVTPAGEGALGFMLAGISRPQGERGNTLTFDEMAKVSQGIDRLGVLRMDVDDLGDIFAAGLPEQERTISRLTNLSKALAYFFGGYVSTLVDDPTRPWADKVQVIYSGGDDVFIVGAWSHLPALACGIRREFARFTCGNCAWGISAGLAIVRSKQPVAAAAKISGDLEHAAKQLRSSGNSKDAIGFLGDVLTWAELGATAAMASELLALMETDARQVPGFDPEPSPEKHLPRGWLRRLGRIAAEYRRAAESFERRNGRKSLREVETAVQRGRWVWMKAYELARATSDPETNRRLETFMSRLPGKTWTAPVGSLETERDVIWLLQPAAIWADWLSRERRR